MYGSFGYFYEQIPMDLVIRSYSFERQPAIYNFDPTSVVPDETAAGIVGDDNAVRQGNNKIFGGFTDPDRPHHHGQYVREGLFGVEREVMHERRGGCPLRLPRPAAWSRTSFARTSRLLRRQPARGQDEVCSSTSTTSRGYQTPKAQRIFRGSQFDCTKRFSDNWSVVASYVCSRSTATTTAGSRLHAAARHRRSEHLGRCTTTSTSSRRAPSSTASRFTANGDLSNDRRSVAKLSGVYVTPFNLSLGLVTYYQTGTPISRIGFSDAYTRPEFFLDTRGSEGRVAVAPTTPTCTSGYPLQLGPVTPRRSSWTSSTF